MAKYNKELFKVLSKKIGSDAGLYSAIRRKEEKFKAVKPEILLYLVANDHKIKISKYEKDEAILEKIDGLLQRDVEQISSVNKTKKNTFSNPKETDPFTISLFKFNLFSDLARECKVRKPYSKEINQAVLNLEVFMRKRMGLDESVYGIKVVDEANKMNIFTRKIKSESEGLSFLYRAAILWLRNSGAHKKKGAEKEECFKIILFTDYLIKLFDELCENAKIKNKCTKSASINSNSCIKTN